MSVASSSGPGRLGSAAPSLSPAGVTTVPSASWWLAPTPSPTPALGRTSTWRCSTTVSPTVSYLVPRGHAGYPLNQTVPGGDPWTTTTTHVYTRVGLGPPTATFAPQSAQWRGGACDPPQPTSFTRSQTPPTHSATLPLGAWPAVPSPLIPAPSRGPPPALPTGASGGPLWSETHPPPPPDLPDPVCGGRTRGVFSRSHILCLLSVR